MHERDGERVISTIKELVSLVNTVIAFLFLIVPILSSIPIYLFTDLSLYVIILLVVLFTIKLIAFLFIYTIYKKKKYKHKFLYREVTFKYLENSYSVNYDMKIMPYVDNFRTLDLNRTCNTVKTKIKCSSPRNAIIAKIPTTNSFGNSQINTVVLGNEYNKNDTIHLLLESTVADDVIYPYYITVVERPTAELKIKIELPLDLEFSDGNGIYNVFANGNITLRIVNARTKKSILEEEAQLTNENSYEWEVNKKLIKVGYEYEIGWNFTEEKLAQLQKLK
ncbi:MAG: hypothetical protein FWE02_06000 [Defluviitaleaceae bacterium]|nr:hypothetical protein [Defluviitaleaceae bacterium]